MKTDLLNALAKKLILVTLMMFTLMSSTAQAGHGMWVWGKTQEALNNTAKAQEIVDFCNKNNITVVYLNAGDNIVGNYAAWESFIERFHLNGIAVEALLGTADWLMPARGWDPPANNFLNKPDRADGLEKVEAVLAYQAAANSLHAFDAMHFDIEIQTLGCAKYDLGLLDGMNLAAVPETVEAMEDYDGRVIIARLNDQAPLNILFRFIPEGGGGPTDYFYSDNPHADDYDPDIAQLLAYIDIEAGSPWNLAHLSDEAKQSILHDAKSLTYHCPNDPDDGALTTEEDRVRWYLEFIESVKAARSSYGFDGNNLPFNWDINMSYDLPNHASIDYTYNGATKPAWQHLFDQFDCITFMTYADRTRFIADALEAELIYIDTLLNYIDTLTSCGSVRFAHEFQRYFRGIDLADEGLHNEDYLTVVNLRQNVDSLMVNRPYYHGWALHAYDNEDSSNGQLTDWLTSNTPFDYPTSMTFTPTGDRKTIPQNTTETIDKPVYVRLKIKADPKLEYTEVFPPGHRWEGQSKQVRNMISLLILGRGYASEDDLDANRADISYDGIAPKGWYFFNDMMWWTDSTATWPQVRDKGVAWANPATTANPHEGVQRNVVLQEGEIYRLIVSYHNENGINGEFISTSLGTLNPEGAEGDSFADPVEIDIYLGAEPNYGTAGEPHLNNSYVIQDSDLDGVSNGTEIQFGTDPFAAPTAGVEVLKRLDGGDYLLEVQREANKTYRLEYSSDLVNWNHWALAASTNNQPLTLLDDGTNTSPDPATTDKRFYRLADITNQGTPVYSDPVGSVTETIGAGFFNLIGVNLSGPVVTTGSFESADDTSATDTDADFLASLQANVNYTLIVTSGPNTGANTSVSASSETTLLTENSLSSSITSGTTYEIRKTLTISDLFGINNEAELAEALSGGTTDADIIWIPNGIGGFDKYYYNETPRVWPPLSVGWKKVGGVDLDASNIPLSGGLIIERKGSSSTSTVNMNIPASANF